MSYLLASALPIWAVLVVYTGGAGWAMGPVRLSSREPFRPLLLAAGLAAWYWWRHTRAEREADGRWLHRRLARAAPVAVALAVVAACAIGVRYGSFAAAGSDSYGYVSQARLWLKGQLRVEQPQVRQFEWRNREWIFAPLGYRPASPDGAIVPTYPAGLPIVMAAFLAVFGESGPFFVVPIFAALAVWLTFLLGRAATASGVAGAVAALLLAASPVFLMQAMVPMSDVPAAAGWALVLVLVLDGRPLGAGVASGLTLAVRPNLLFVALVPAIAWRGRREYLGRYALGVAPGLALTMGINALVHGGPLATGYGSLAYLFTLSSLVPNLRSYAAWLVETETPLVFLALVPLLVRPALVHAAGGASPRVCLAAVAGLTLASYLFYAVFDHWFYLRFLLPAFPALFVLIAAALRWIARALPVEARAPAVAAAVVVIMAHGVDTGRHAGIFRQAAHERRYLLAAAEVAARTPANAMVFAVQHSGSVRYYAGRVTLRYDWLGDVGLDQAVRDLRARGYRPFLVVDDWEEEEFRSRFPASPLGRLDWPPLARVPGDPEVRIYEMQDGGPAAIQ